MIKKRVMDVLKRIQSVRQAHQINYPIRLVAVSKTKSVDEIMEAYECGIRHFGQNYAEELEEKQLKLPQDIQWHFIGHLQSNKIKKILVNNLYCLQTVDRESLAEKLNKQLLKDNKTLNIMIQVKSSEQDTKSGIQPKELFSLYEFIRDKCPQLKFNGLMTIGKEGDEVAFKQLVELKQAVCSKYGIKELGLSMGMSGDFQKAIEFGSNSVRVGSLIFGARNYPAKGN